MTFLSACSTHQEQERPGLGQEGAPRPEMKQPDPEARFLELRQRLSLTDEQAPKVRKILDAERTARNELMESMGGKGREESTELRTKMEDLEWKSLTGLTKVLTREQMDAYLKSLDEEKAKMRANSPGHGTPGKRGGPPPRR
jgi:Spy/CpxP family protein refolding chaperone